MTQNKIKDNQIPNNIQETSKTTSIIMRNYYNIKIKNQP